jgi:2-polyprenyl-3-methyl-5-hydroxy-6-metoxy-1,4-benzoquinol methylase
MERWFPRHLVYIKIQLVQPMTAPGHFHETDPSGLQTLERFAQARRFNRWMFDTIQPYCKGQVLEVGSGIGNLSQYFLEKNFRLTASDLRDEYINILHGKFGRNPNLAGIKSIDLAVENFETRFSDLLQQFDTVVALNVIEHIQDDHLAISNCKKLLKPGGHLVILVPAFSLLYNLFDQELGHYVRYNRKTLNELLGSQELEVFHTQYFNSIGIIGWIINGSLFRKRLIPRKQLQIYDKLVPVIKAIDAITFRKVGLSVLSVARKPEQNN